MATSSGTAAELVPQRPTLTNLRSAAATCTACDLYKNATQTVFGEGLKKAEVMLVGEQPGDKEDVAGHPFVGPAGKLLDTALEEAGIDRSQAYVTNIVKHFKWKRTVGAARAPGKRRLHEKPNAYEVTACRPWLEAEIRQVGPKIVVCLGSTAAQALLGKDFRVTRQRGEFFASELAPFLTATVHPSSILRAPDADAREQEMRLFIHDLRAVADKLADLGTAPDEPVAGGASGGGYT
jgi:uracil-DNA glycosylase